MNRTFLDEFVNTYEQLYTTEGLEAADKYLYSTKLTGFMAGAVKQTVINSYFHENLNGNDKGFLFMLKESDDCFHMVPVDYHERDYINSSISLTIEGDVPTPNFNNDMVLRDEVPRLTMEVSSIFVDISSINKVLARIYQYFKYE